MDETELKQVQDNARFLADVTRGDRYFSEDVDDLGEFRKHYSYDQFDEVSLDNYENGCVVYEAGRPERTFSKVRRQVGFEYARLRGERSKALNRCF